MPTIDDYLDSLRGKRLAVLGMGVSNTPLIRMLLRAELDVTVRDKAARSRLGETARELESLGAKLILGEQYLEELNEDVIFRTPGISPNTPQLRRAVARGSELTSEMEVFFRACPCKLIAVTGSDGKTTTTTLITELLRAAGYHVYVGGNIGRPLLPDAAGMEPEDVAVLELSSFQLMTMEQSPHVAVLTNLSPNHLDYHGTMEEYIRAKENIFLHQGPTDRAVFNFDNKITRELSKKAKGFVCYFSRQTEPEGGVFTRDGAIWTGGRPVLPFSDILLPGVHNIENYMAAIAAVEGMVPDRCIREVARNFHGVEHRIELVRELDGVKYYNDSIGTSPTRTIAGLRSFSQKVILIAGGYDKGVPFTELGAEIVEHVKALVLSGHTAPAIRRAVEDAPGYQPGAPEIVDAEDFTAAVQTARRLARPGDIVMLSPACAAFDQFKNFMERGKRFKEIVNHF